jgi:hypothetical protein
MAGMALGIGVVYEFAPLLAHRLEAGAITDFLKRANGEAPTSFTFAQFKARPTRWAPKRLRLRWN